jgi:uncharacterized protein (TIGR03435 family)
MISSLLKGLSIFTSCAVISIAQSASGPEFEAASLKPSAPETGGVMIVSCGGGPGSPDPGLFLCSNSSIWDLVSYAYGKKGAEVVAADWMQSARFNINARIPKDATKDDLRVMLRNLLKERLSVAVHEEVKQKPGYNLIVAKNGPKFKQATPEVPATGGQSLIPNPRDVKTIKEDEDGYPKFAPGERGTKMTYEKARMCDPRITMKQLAQSLTYRSDGPVDDMTGLAAHMIFVSIGYMRTRLHRRPCRIAALPPPISTSVQRSSKPSNSSWDCDSRR